MSCRARRERRRAGYLALLGKSLPALRVRRVDGAEVCAHSVRAVRGRHRLSLQERRGGAGTLERDCRASIEIGPSWLSSIAPRADEAAWLALPTFFPLHQSISIRKMKRETADAQKPQWSGRGQGDHRRVQTWLLRAGVATWRYRLRFSSAYLECEHRPTGAARFASQAIWSLRDASTGG